MIEFPKRRFPHSLSRPAGIWVLASLILVVFGLYFFYWWFIDWLMPPASNDSAGTFGEKFGALNTLFAGLAFAGLIYTVWLQRYDLMVQAHALSTSQQAQEDLARSSLFIQVLQLHQQAVNELTLLYTNQSGVGEVAKGQVAFDKFYEEINLPFPPDHLAPESAGEAIFESELARSPAIWRYVQNLHLLLYLLDASPPEMRSIHLSVLRAQFSQAERVWLLCYCLTPMGATTFRSLVLKAGLFDDWTPPPAYRHLIEVLQRAPVASS